MKCPTCNTPDLLMTERLGIEIDYCPQCRGVWLDRGELDKLLERAATASAPPAAPSYAPASPNRKQPDFEDSDYRDGRRHQRSHKKSWLSDIFD